MTAGGLVLIAVGAILRFAVTAEVSGVSISTVGLILLIVGGVTLVIGLVRQFAGGGSSASHY